MITKKGAIARRAIVLKGALSTSGELVARSLRPGSKRRWMVPLLVFLCINGLILTLAAGVEALAPFVYSIF